MSIPAPFRDVVQQRAGDRRVVLMPHRGDWDCLEGQTTTHVSRINEAANERFAPDDVSVEEDMARLRAFSLSVQVQYEETGRIVLPEDLREFAEIEGEVLLVGLGAHFQIWNPDLFLEQTGDERLKKFIRRKLEKARAK
ncbi:MULTISPECIES: division/cell wall cluster transcriptional repressor MraZ [Pacificimonas]|nr:MULTISPECIES: hypothetical protein [Pacificimonas]MBZ6378914.1 hypothetical protein [Pacificimonas aurantium]